MDKTKLLFYDLDPIIFLYTFLSFQENITMGFEKVGMCYLRVDLDDLEEQSFRFELLLEGHRHYWH